MIESEKPVDEQQPQNNTPASDLPDVISGWVSHTTKSGNILEYWRAGSNHIACSFEQLVARQRRDGEINLFKRCYNQYRQLINTENICQHDLSNFEWVCERAKKQMDRYPGIEPFTEPPTFPTTVGDWYAVSTPKDQPLGVAKWEIDLGAAELIAEQTEIVSHYSHTRRPHKIYYRELDTEPTTVVDDVNRTQAYEIAVNTLESLPQPVSQIGEAKDGLQEIKGIGPSKSRDFLLLGITSCDELRAHILSEDNPLNHHHSEAVEKLLTETIRTDATHTESK